MGDQAEENGATSSPRERPRTFSEILVWFAVEDLGDPAFGSDTWNPNSQPSLSG
jgi:hypothetical protein